MTAKYLYTGLLPRWGSCEARRRALAGIGREVVHLSSLVVVRAPWRQLTALQFKMGMGPGVWRYNRALLRIARREQPDVIWVDKGTLVWPATLRRLKAATDVLLVHYNTDDILLQPRQWRHFIPSVPLYDIHFTTNVHNVEDLGRLGARRVVHTRLGYDHELHRPLRVDEATQHELGADIGFIGHWEPATEELVLRLVSEGFRVRVRGANWDRARSRTRLRGVIQPGLLWGDDYVRALCVTKVNLGIVSQWNRSQSAGRTFEIPACGGFLLGQRTPEHQRFYREGHEAEFFDGGDELIEKAGHYLRNEDERLEIAAAGHARCLSSNYAYRDIMREMVPVVESGRCA